MDSDQLRLILLILGAVLVVLIYAWDRYKRSRRRLRPMPRRQHRKQPVMQDDELAEGSLPHMSADEESAEIEPLQLGEEHDLSNQSRFGVQAELEFSAMDELDYIHQNPDLQEDVPHMVLQIAVVRNGKSFNGIEIEKALADVGLQRGEMDVFHYYDEKRSDQVLFSIASMVEPGQFPNKDMASFTTPGLVLFTQLPGVRDGMQIYSEMLFTAERLAGLLGGSLQDETHSTLSKQTIEHTKDAIQEHRRKVQLVRRR